MNICDLNTVDMDGGDITLSQYSGVKKNLKGLRILDGVVRDMVGYKLKENGFRDSSIWEVIDADEVLYYMRDQDIKHLYRKSLEVVATAKLIQCSKTIKHNYLGSPVRIEALSKTLLKQNSTNGRHTLDFALNVIFDRFTVTSYAGKVGNPNFQTANGWYCIDALKDEMFIITDEQIVRLKSKQKKIEKKVRKKNESKLTVI